MKKSIPEFARERDEGMKTLVTFCIRRLDGMRVSRSIKAKRQYRWLVGGAVVCIPATLQVLYENYQSPHETDVHHANIFKLLLY